MEEKNWETGSEEGEKYLYLSEQERKPSKAEHYIRPTTPGVTKTFEVRTESPLQSSSNTKDSNSQSGGVGSKTSVLSQNSGSKNHLAGSSIFVVVIQPIPQSTATRRLSDDLRMPVFNGNRSQDPEQHMFVCETIWIVKQIQDQDAQIVQLATMFRDRALVWYMKF